MWTCYVTNHMFVGHTLSIGNEFVAYVDAIGQLCPSSKRLRAGLRGFFL
jgi:hypothetical protein